MVAVTAVKAVAVTVVKAVAVTVVKVVAVTVVEVVAVTVVEAVAVTVVEGLAVRVSGAAPVMGGAVGPRRYFISAVMIDEVCVLGVRVLPGVIRLSRGEVVRVGGPASAVADAPGVV